MDAREIIATWLREHGYDGLFNPGVCGCLIDDLIPCDGPCSNCEAGYKADAEPDSEFYDGPGSWVIQRERPVKKSDALKGE